ncbi:MAG: hypothetical protein RI973_570 [Bacteroidota bacterium]
MRQIRELLECIDQETFTRPLEVFNGSTIGQHFRHVIEFYACLAKGLDAGLVDYAARDRDLLAETVPSCAASTLEQLGEIISLHDDHMRLGVLAEFATDTHQERPLVSSSLGRELMFAHDHAIHHLAIIKIGLRMAAPQLELNQNIGVAPSTIKHRERQPVAK